MAAQSSSSSPSSSSSSTPSSTSIYPSSSSALNSQRYSCPTNSTEQQLNHLNQLNLNAAMDALDLIQAQRLIADNQSLNTPNVGNNLLSATATSSIQNSTNSTGGGLIQQLTALNHHSNGNNTINNQDPLQSIVQQLFLHYNGNYLTQRGHI